MAPFRLTFAARPCLDDVTLPSRVPIAETAEPGNDRQPALFKRAILTIFRQIAAKIEQRTPRTFDGACRTRIGQLDRCKNSNRQNNAQHVQPLLCQRDGADTARLALLRPPLVARPGLGHRPCPPWVRVTEASITRQDIRPACLERPIPAIFVDGTRAKRDNRAPRALLGIRRPRIK